MAKAIIAYDKDLPEIPGRCPWEQPVSFLIKDPAAPNGWRIDDSGRRASKLLLIKNLRKAAMEILVYLVEVVGKRRQGWSMPSPKCSRKTS